MASLEAQRDAALKHARELAEKFAEVNLDEASEIYKEAFSYFQDGDIEKALESLDDKILD